MTGRLMILVLAAVLAVGGVATAFAVNAGEGDDDTPQPVEMRKDDAAEAETVEPQQDDDDDTAGDDAPGDRDATMNDATRATADDDTRDNTRDDPTGNASQSRGASAG